MINGDCLIDCFDYMFEEMTNALGFSVHIFYPATVIFWKPTNAFFLLNGHHRVSSVKGLQTHKGTEIDQNSRCVMSTL